MKRKSTTKIAAQAAPQHGKAATPTPRSGSPRLRTLDDVAVEIARVYRKAARGETPTSEATRFTYMLATLGKTIQAAQQSSAQQFINGTVVDVGPPTLADFYETVQNIPTEQPTTPTAEEIEWKPVA